MSTDRRLEILQLTKESSDRLGELINEGIEDGSLRDVDPLIIENAIVGAMDAAPEIETHMRFSDNSRVSAEYLELFFNGIASRD